MSLDNEQKKRALDRLGIGWTPVTESREIDGEEVKWHVGIEVDGDEPDEETLQTAYDEWVEERRWLVSSERRSEKLRAARDRTADLPDQNPVKAVLVEIIDALDTGIEEE